ncbi:TPA_asm: hypothetical protein vir525_00018 [Caudoviricetes sp. vir525]|jgi:hypothetical protein|nr:TPA_asm: hypothetical protein vir525_00018 [Caudoviricetes sp. vir525]
MMMQNKNMDVLYAEHLDSPYVENPLSRTTFERLYARFEDVEARANAALEANQWALHDRLDHESQKLCARLGY